MNTIWKYPIAVADDFELMLPAGAQLVHIESQGPLTPCMWFRVDSDSPMTPRKFAVRGTGHDCSDVGKHLGSCQLRGGQFVFHIFEAK